MDGKDMKEREKSRKGMGREFCPPTFRVLPPPMRDLFEFWERSDNISETMQDRDMVAMGHLMWPIEWHHCQCPSTTL